MMKIVHPTPSRYFLYAEDDPDDQEALTEMITRIDPEMSVVICNQGLALMQFLEALPAGEHFPCCIILDMNMPMWDGLRTLEELKKHHLFQHLPVIMFTTSSSGRDVNRTLALGAEAFITKPLREMELKQVANQFSLFCKRAPTKK
ncbi:MAG: response regulator [Chitinophagaceae bacterium]|nr:response regulator [Chitinophagaceae bacterium]